MWKGVEASNAWPCRLSLISTPDAGLAWQLDEFHGARSATLASA